jgi:4-amino-4-deoxy-L-arabinose transferase-like glycosyltransferase
LETAELSPQRRFRMPTLQRAAGVPAFGNAPSRTWSAGVLVAVTFGLFAAVWLAVLDATSRVAPVDNIEQLVWSRSLQWGYYKHPPLPTVIARLATAAFGATPWTTYLLGAATTLAAMAIFWRLLRHLRGVRYANIGVLAALCITFYNDRLYYYNHNIVLLLLVTAAAALCWRAFEQRRLRWWLALGAVLGLGALTKYQIAVTVVSLACFWLSQRAWRDPVHRLGILLAALVALVLFAPHVLWLRTHDFGPIRYALGSSLGVDLGPGARTLNAVGWLADALLNRSAPALLLLWLALRSARRLSAFASPDAPRAGAQAAPSSRALLVCWGVVPLAFTALVGIAFGAELQLQWGTPFLLFIVPCVMELRPVAFWNRASQQAAWRAFGAIQLLLVAINVATSPIGLRSLEDTHWRTFSAEQLMARIAPEARAQLGGPIAVVTGSIGEAGALALLLPDHPLVLVDDRYDRSPWVSRDVVAACGALQVIHSKLPVAHAAPVGAPFKDLYWRVLPPQRDGSECDGSLQAGRATGRGMRVSGP